MEKINLRACIAEAIGTFVLVFFACGVAAVTKGSLFVTSLTFGLVIVIMSLLIGKISGCHINPAVSFACLITRRMSVRDFVGYVIAQVVGGLLGAIILFALIKMNNYSGSFFETAASNLTYTKKLGLKPNASADLPAGMYES